MLNGEGNILTANPIVFFARTSGTTSMGSKKIIPNSNYRCPLYEIERINGSIGEPKVLLVKQGTFTAATAMLVKSGVSPLRVKIPRYARRPDLLALLQENTSIPT